MAAREKQPGNAGLFNSGECLHRSGDGAIAAPDRHAVCRDAKPHSADRCLRTVSRGAVRLLRANRGGQTISHLLPCSRREGFKAAIGSSGGRFCGRRSDAGCESAGRGRGFYVGGRVGGERRWKSAGIHDRQYRLSPVHAACEESVDGKNAAFVGGAGRLGDLGGGRSHAALQCGGRGDEAAVPDCSTGTGCGDASVLDRRGCLGRPR